MSENVLIHQCTICLFCTFPSCQVAIPDGVPLQGSHGPALLLPFSFLLTLDASPLYPPPFPSSTAAEERPPDLVHPCLVLCLRARSVVLRPAMA